MADDKVAEAVMLVARRIAANALRTDYPTAPEHSEYAEVGEHDWKEIERILDQYVLAHFMVRDSEYEAAYEFLDARADAE